MEEKKLSESLEKYLLAIWEISKSSSNIIVKDVASYLKIGGASTSVAIKTLAEKGYINYVPYGAISLTSKGINTVQVKIYRHNTIFDFLNRVLEIDASNAEKNAAAIEYSMTQEVLSKFVHFLDFMNQCSCKEPKWLKSCKHSLLEEQMPKKCENCTSGCCNCNS